MGMSFNLVAGIRRLRRWTKKKSEAVAPATDSSEKRLNSDELAELLAKVELKGGFTLMTVGRVDDGGIVPAAERFSVRVELFKQPCVAALLRQSKQQLDYIFNGVLRIPCDADHFRLVIRKGGCSNMASVIGYDD
ncbi:hypothetical protein KSP40_PGU017012 [Platanthera guangdongensis]|uniref:Uncharacterized protein n=1 Tax=Platanthera guangdongensis TaxID=2320717 RepID=A0ABR2N469_9ASPA